MKRQWKDLPSAHDWDTRAEQALAEARRMPNGPERSKALRKAGQLRVAADMKRLLSKPREVMPPPLEDSSMTRKEPASRAAILSPNPK